MKRNVMNKFDIDSLLIGLSVIILILGIVLNFTVLFILGLIGTLVVSVIDFNKMPVPRIDDGDSDNE
jgi:hypothetical protein